MKKVIQFLLILILLSVFLLIVVFVFNPFGLRNKMIGQVINAYLDSAVETNVKNNDSSASSTVDSSVKNGSVQVELEDKNPLLNPEQEKTLESYGVDVEKLPKTISPEMEKCFLDKLGEARGMELVNGDTPSALEVIKIRTCISL